MVIDEYSEAQIRTKSPKQALKYQHEGKKKIIVHGGLSYIEDKDFVLCSLIHLICSNLIRRKVLSIVSSGIN
jgi:hypothetical protein